MRERRRTIIRFHPVLSSGKRRAGKISPRERGNAGTRECSPRGQFLIQIHQRGGAFGFLHFQTETVGCHDGAVVGLVRPAQFGRHRQLVVQVGKRRIGIQGACVQNALRRLFDLRLSRIAKWGGVDGQGKLLYTMSLL